MRNSEKKRRNKLKIRTRLMLFLSSYIPLFVIIIAKQLFENSEYLFFGGFSCPAFLTFMSKFGMSFVLGIIVIVTAISLPMIMRVMKSSIALSGEIYRIEKIQNKNNESIGYVATYLLPFVYQSFSTPFEIISFIIIVFVIFIIYINSTLVVVNPILNMKYSLYDLEYVVVKSNEQRSGTFIITQHNVRRSDIILAKELGNNTFIGEVQENDD